MSYIRLQRTVAAVVLAVLLGHASGAAHAASDADDGPAPAVAAAADRTGGGDLAEVVVTAEKRDTRLIDTPAAVTVFDAASIKASGIVMPADFLTQTSNVTFTTAVNPGDFFVNVRGQGSIRSAEPSVAIIIDGVPVAGPDEFNTALFGLDQIEVLKGPEGAYWGRDASAGAIIITTEKPTEEFTGNTLFSYGNDNSYNAQTTASEALIPGALLARISGSVHGTDGSYTNPNTDEKSLRYAEQSARLRLLYDQGGPLTIDFSLTAIHGEGGSDAFVAKIDQVPGLSPNGTVVGGVPVQDVSPNYNLNVPFVSDVPGRYQRQVESIGLVTGYDLGDWSKVTSITGIHVIREYDGGKNYPYGNPDDASTNFGAWQVIFGDKTQWNSTYTTQYDEELRLTSTGTHFLDWQIGAQFVFNHENFIEDNTLNGALPAGITPAELIGYGGYQNGVRTLVGGGEPQPFPLTIMGISSPYPTTSYNSRDFVGTNYSPFGNFTVNFSDALKLRVAGRWETEVRRVNEITPNLVDPFTGGSFNDCISLTGGTAAQCAAGTQKTFHEFQPKITLDYKVQEDTSVYASYGIGFKTGGFNGIGVRDQALNGYIAAYEGAGQSPSVAVSNAAKAVYTQDFYNKEVDTTYEVGGKTQLFDKRLFLSAAAFITYTSNAQYYDFDPVSYVQSINSIDKVRTPGFEVEANGKLTDWLTLFANYGYINPKITAFAADPSDVGNYVPQVSRATFDGGFQVNRLVTQGRTVTARLEYQWTGDTYYTIDNLPEYERTPFGLVNARVGYLTDRWELTAWGKNILDQRYVTEVTAILEPYSTALNYAQRQTWGIDFRVKY